MSTEEDLARKAKLAAAKKRVMMKEKSKQSCQWLFTNIYAK